MNNEDLFKAMGDTDGDLIERSEKKRTPNRALRIAAIAAAAVLVTGLAGSAAVKLWKTYGRQAESPPQLEPQIKPGTTIPPDPTPEPINLFAEFLPTPEPGTTPDPNAAIQSFADYDPYKSASELAGYADLIIRAEIYDSYPLKLQTSFDFDENGDPIPNASLRSLMTSYEIDVTGLYKWTNDAGKLQHVLTWGGEAFGMPFSICPRSPVFEVGKEYVLFLKIPDKEAWDIWGDSYAFVIGYAEDIASVEYDSEGNASVESRFPELTFDWLEELKKH